MARSVHSKIKGLLRCLILAPLFLFPHSSGAVIDEMGREVPIHQVPERIVSLAPNITETLFALGLEDRIAGVTLFSNYPEAARTKPKVGSYINLSLEKIVALKPDLVIGTADGNKREIIDRLDRLGVPVYIINPATLEDIFESVLGIGGLTGRSERAEEIVRDLRGRMNRVRARTEGLKRPRVFFQIGIHPIVSVGGGTIHDRLIELAGGCNVAGDLEVSYPRLNMERVLAAAPEIIIVSSMKRGGDFKGVMEEWEKWKEIPAVRNNKIFMIDSDLTDHFSPRIIQGLEALAEMIHPERAPAGDRRRQEDAAGPDPALPDPVSRE